MEFRPCIDIHNGKVKQIVGGTLTDEKDRATENFVSAYDARFYAEFYKNKNVKNGHIILLNPGSSPYYEVTRAQAMEALQAYPGGLQIGGGVNADNGMDYIHAGASHVIVTSYVFKDGRISYDNLERLAQSVGKEHIVLDLSCRKRGDSYYVVTDRWQKFTSVKVDANSLDELAAYCDEFLIHAVDVEGKASGIEEELVAILGEWNKIPITYAGGVHSFSDIYRLKELGKNKIHVTIGSALNLFGGNMEFDEVLKAVNG
ncbi:MAG: phosphoribosylformimino-5-aminoimidazole carboxamide ribotide isomerase [Lachnospiraceae bacterium]|nr:phosphoribosylformimino-5-aminoimidazole carboxamide ribotide isomerase [Lachnospiraceae bacterium]